MPKPDAKALLLGLFALLAAPCAVPAQGLAAPTPPVIATSEGAVRGFGQDGVERFMGIPYAKPPVGPLRWAPTAPATAHQEILEAKAVGSACLQPPGMGEATSSEDCLYLNIWRPAGAKAGQKLPIIVYIHGGAFILGSGHMVDLSTLSRRGFIGVSFNYRLGALGYFANRAIQSADKTRTLGNFALMDQLTALRWVQRNAAALGGDPHNVTAWGTSAGATQLFSLLAIPEAKGLFARAILESGGAAEYSNLTPQQALATGESAVKTLGCSQASDIAACLRALPAQRLLAVTALKWRPIVDGALLPVVPARAFGTGRFNRVPVMIGGVFDEGTLFVPRGLTADAYPAALHALAAPGADLAKIDAAYPLSAYPSPAQALARATGDAMYGCGNSVRRVAIARWAPVYGWEFVDPALSYRDHPSPFYYGSAHGMDGFYLGDQADQVATYPFFDATAKTAAGDDAAGRESLAHLAATYVANFARTGNPSGANVTTAWPRYDGAHRPVMELTYPHVRVTDGAFETMHKCALWPDVPGAA